MTFKQHIPPMVSTDRAPEHFRFETADELLAHPWIAEWETDPGFTRYSVSLFSADSALLMAEYNRGKVGWWWVLGYLRDGDARALGLPLFQAPKEIIPPAADAGRIIHLTATAHGEEVLKRSENAKDLVAEILRNPGARRE